MSHVFIAFNEKYLTKRHQADCSWHS